MSQLSIDKKTIMNLFSGKGADFLIPDYQRPYSWDIEHCETLWNDIVSFAIPDNAYDKFDEDDEYFLGSIVTFTNANGKKEVIDGQQRLTTISLLLRALYCKFGKMKDENTKAVYKKIGECIWKTDEFGNPIEEKLKIDSEVAADDDKKEFLNILKTGEAPLDYKSKYAENYRFFVKKIADFNDEYSGYLKYLSVRLLNNCILLPIDAESQDVALRIFSTLNDRGMPLSDSDIFKAQMYKHYSDIGKKDEFIKAWKDLEDKAKEIFSPRIGTPMDELFTKYMYFLRAKGGNKNPPNEALRKFYEKDSYSLLKDDNALADLKSLCDLWSDIRSQNARRFQNPYEGQNEALKWLFILNFAPNDFWTYLVSVYYMGNKDQEGSLGYDAFCRFLRKIAAFILARTFTNPGVSALRRPAVAEMVRMVNGDEVQFAEDKFDEETLRSAMGAYDFNNQRVITKSMLVLRAFRYSDEQAVPSPSLDPHFEIEHIYARKRADSLTDPNNLESIGNKCILESRINIRASDYKISDKKKYYLGYTDDKGGKKEGTIVKELRDLALSGKDFTEEDIVQRKQAIIDDFISFVRENGLLK